jgi:hypothetical protein
VTGPKGEKGAEKKLRLAPIVGRSDAGVMVRGSW